MREWLNKLLDITGDEAMFYNQFMRVYGVRERINEIAHPKVQNLGDVELPRNTLLHYLPSLPGEVGPENEKAAFLYQQKGKINLIFDWEYTLAVNPGGIIKRPKDKIKIESQYFKSHYRFTRIRSLAPFLPKEQELIVNNLAPAFLVMDYQRKTPATFYIKYYNEVSTVITAVNRIAEASTRNQFWEIKLPTHFIPYTVLHQSFEKSRKFFKADGRFDKAGIEVLKHFAAGRSYWLMDLYGFLMGYDYAQYSVFNKLTKQARERCNFVFSYNGKCIIINIASLLRLMAYSDKSDTQTVTSSKVNHFKRFYLNLISLVNGVDVDTLLEKNNERQKEVSEERQRVDNRRANSDMVDSSTTDKGDDTVHVDVERETVREDTRQVRERESKRRQPKTEIVETTPVVVEEEIIPDADEMDDDETAWGEDIPDSAFEQAINTESTTVVKAIPYTPTSVIERHLAERAKEGKLSVREKEYFTAVAKSYENIEVEGRTLAEIIDIKPEDMVLDDVKLTEDAASITDKSVLRSRSHTLSQGYRSKFLQRNIVEMFTHVQNASVCLTDLRKEPVTTASSKYDLWSFTTQPLDGNKRTCTIRVPRVQKDGTFLINGVKCYMQFQRMEKPVRKVTELAVQLTSYYDKGRIRIERSKKVVDDYGRWLKLKIIAKSKAEEGIKVVLGSSPYKEKNMCPYYAILASRFKLIQTKDYTFHFDTDNLLKTFPKAKRYCNKETWCVGERDGNYLVIDKTGMVSWNNEEELGYIEEILNIPIQRAPLPCATININGYRFPAVIVLSYWMGFNNVLNAIGADYRSVSPNVREKLSPDEYAITFSDEKLIFNRRDELTTLIVSGLTKLPFAAEFTRSHLDDPNIWFGLMDDSKVKPTHFKEMSQIYDMFIDPITKRLLVKDGYPTSMEFLSIEAIKLLLTRYEPSEVEITEQRFVGYERFSGHIYRELCRSAREFRNKPQSAKRTFDVNPDAVMLKIITDSSVQAVEDVNPIHQIKQQDEVTFGGTMGRAEQAMVKRTRGMLQNYRGIISEAGKDSGKVGFVSYLTVDPKITDYYGNINVNEPATKSGLGSVSMNTMYGFIRDDAKRALFAGVQRSQMMATVNYTPNPIRTSYDTMVAQRNNETYSSIALKDGVVKSIDPENGMVVTYSDGTEGRFPLGLTIGKGAGEYHKHNKITDLKVGDKFKKSWILAWDDMFYDRDELAPGKVVIKMCVLARVALFEDQTTYEDSIATTASFNKRSAIPFIKINTINAYDDAVVKLFVKKGDRVDYDQVMCDVEDPTTMLDSEDEAFAGLERYGVKQLKANMAGAVSKIELLYNGDIDSFHPETQKLIKRCDGQRATKASYMDDEAATGNVGGNTHISKVDVYPGGIQLNVYLEEILDSTTADKLVLGNQMKGTIGYIYPIDIFTEDGRPVHVIFSVKSLLARMVLSFRDKLIVNELNNVYTHRMIEQIEGSTNWVV